VLILKLRRSRVRNDGVRSVVPLVRTKTRKYGPVLDEKALSVKTDWLVSGANSSGKTRWITRVHTEAPGIWRKHPAIMLRAHMPLSAWGEDERVKAFVAAKGEHWGKLRTWERTERLISWVEQTRAVVLIDDAHLLTGRKADIMVQVVRGAGRVVATTTTEGRIPITLRMALQSREPEHIHLDSDAPYDMTTVIAWMVAVLATAAGAWPVAAVVGGLHLLGRGARSAKQS
jgi:hypothetical protein